MTDHLSKALDKWESQAPAGHTRYRERLTSGDMECFSLWEQDASGVTVGHPVAAWGPYEDTSSAWDALRLWEMFNESQK